MKLRTQIIGLVLSTLIFSGLVFAWVFISVSVKESQSQLNDYQIFMSQQLGLDLKNRVEDLERKISQNKGLKLDAPYIEEINFETTNKSDIKKLSVLDEKLQYSFVSSGYSYKVTLNKKFFGTKGFSDQKIQLSYVFADKAFSFNQNKSTSVDSELAQLIEKQKPSLISSVTLKDNFYTIMPAFSGYIVATSPTSHLYNIFNDYIGKTAPYFLSILILFVLLSWWIGSRIARPLENLTQWTKKISSGEWNVAFETGTNTQEIGRLEEAFETMGQELEERERKLMQAERLSALGQISVGIAHEIKNPLNVISSYAQLMLRKTKDEDQVKKLDIIEDAVKRAANIVNDLMVYAGHRPLNTKDVEIASFLKDLQINLTPEVASIVTITNNSQQKNISVDEDFFHQVLINFIVNASHATEGVTNPQIEVRCSDESDAFVLSIKDNGSGIDKKDLPHIFEPFFTTKGVGKGTGLGLAFCHGIIQKHNGSVEVFSQSDQGTEFIIKLPLG